MEAVCFKRHEENPFDTLDIGRVEERRKEKYHDFVNGHINNLKEIFSKFKGVSMQGWENLADRNPQYSDPYDGMIVKFLVTTYPAIKTEKLLMGEFEARLESGSSLGEFETRLKSGTSFVTLHLDSFNHDIRQFGSAEECLNSLESWLEKFTEKPEAGNNMF